MDAEGAAMEVLQGAITILRRDRPEVESGLLFDLDMRNHLNEFPEAFEVWAI